MISNEVYFSPRWKDILGYKVDEIDSSFSVWEKLVHKDDLSNAFNEIDNMIKNEDKDYQFNVKFRMLGKDGRYVPILSRAKKIFDQNGELLRLVGAHVDISEIVAILETSQDITKLKNIQDELKHQAEHDSLTGLPNRVLFLDRINQSIKNAQRYSEKLAVSFIDLDHFKEVNDSLRHKVGDILLAMVSKKFSEIVRQSDTVARLGGDEFAIIISHFNKDDGASADALVKNADAAMYKVKNSGRNNYQFYTADMTEKVFERVMLETQTRQSIASRFQRRINSWHGSFDSLEPSGHGFGFARKVDRETQRIERSWYQTLH